MPLHASKISLILTQAVSVILMLSLIPICTALAQEQAIVEIPSMTVFGIKKPDNSFTQFSEVEWHPSNDPTIVGEKDGSYTANSTTNSYSLKNLLEALGRPTVNIDLAYARNSVSMTAEGSLMLDTLHHAFRYLDNDITLELTPTVSGSDASSQKMTQRRLEVLLKSVERAANVSIKVLPAKVAKHQQKQPSSLDLWRVRIQRQTKR